MTNFIANCKLPMAINRTFSVILILMIFIQGNEAICQNVGVVEQFRSNTIKVNITNPLIFGGKSFIVGYERPINAHQSFSVNLGQFSLPKLLSINTDSIQGVSKSSKSRGLSISADYRFYLTGENRYPAPRGVYIGPYTSFNVYERECRLTANTAAYTGDFTTDLSFRVATLGFQLGYQFIFCDRLTLDMILFGPGISSYKIEAALSTSLDPDQEAEIYKRINGVLNEKIPGYSLVVKPGTFERTGSGTTTSFGYRYVVMMGFRF